MTSPDTPPLQVDSVGARHGSALLAAVGAGEEPGDPAQGQGVLEVAPVTVEYLPEAQLSH